MAKPNHIPEIELRRLLYELRDRRPDICIRFRLLGEMWQSNHLRVIKLTDKGVVLFDEQEGKVYVIQDLRNVMQFELDQSFQQYQPHFHYEVNLTQDSKVTSNSDE